MSHGAALVLRNMGSARHGIPFSESRAVTVCTSLGLTWVDGEQGRFGNMEDTEVEDTWSLLYLPFHPSVCLTYAKNHMWKQSCV